MPKSPSLKRVTFLLDPILDKNIELLSMFSGQMKMHLAQEAFVDLLKKKGIEEPLQPIEQPWDDPVQPAPANAAGASVARPEPQRREAARPAAARNEAAQPKVARQRQPDRAAQSPHHVPAPTAQHGARA